MQVSLSPNTPSVNFGFEISARADIPYPKSNKLPIFGDVQSLKMAFNFVEHLTQLK